MSDFPSLSDTPANYTGQALQGLRVNAGETGLEFVALSTGADFTSLTDTPANYTGAGLQVVRVNAGETGLEFATVATGGPIEVEDEGISLSTAITKINFAGAGVTATEPVADEILVTIPGGGSALKVEDEGISLSTAVTKINFAGAGVTATEPVSDEILVTIPGGSTGESLETAVNQTTHGFAVGNVLYHNGTSYALADASAIATAEVVGIVSAVADVDNFTLTTGGRITGLSGLTAGEAHFLSETAGAITATAPTTIGAIVKPILVADSATTGYVFNMRGDLITAGNDSYRQSFTNGDLTAGVLTVTHNLNQQYNTVAVYDNNDLMIIPNEITATSTTACDVDLTSFGAITGTWNVVVIG